MKFQYPTIFTTSAITAVTILRAILTTKPISKVTCFRITTRSFTNNKIKSSPSLVTLPFNHNHRTRYCNTYSVTKSTSIVKMTSTEDATTIPKITKEENKDENKINGNINEKDGPIVATSASDNNKNPQNKNNNDKKRRKHFQNKWDSNKKRKNNNKNDDDDEVSKRDKKNVVHEGSFANIEMQKLFNIIPKKPLPDEEEPKKSKKKVAMLVSFLGTNYVGMQMNEKQKTIHSLIEYAMYQGGFLSPSNFGYPSKYSWSNSARTDKGVHALAQVVSCKIEIPLGMTLNDVRKGINQYLPNDIKVLDIIKVTKGFNAKTSRDKVRYQYILPSYILLDPKELCKIFQDCDISMDRTKQTSVKDDNDSTNDDDSDTKTTLRANIFTKEEIQKLQSKLTSYRLPQSKLDNFQKVLQTYKGTHSFHNYTNRKKPGDASCKRYILSFDVIPAQTQISPYDNSQWIVTQVVGQSFLLHQIRKMISMAIDVCRGSVPDINIMDKSFDPLKVIPLDVAPSQGLLLEMSYFDGYNKYKVLNDHNHEQTETYEKNVLSWHVTNEQNGVLTDIQKEIKDFKENVIIDYTMKEEFNDGNFLEYIYLHESKFTYEGFDDVDIVRG